MAQMELSSRSPRKIFLTGSSQARQGLDARYLNSKFSKNNVTFYNLGFAKANPIDMFMLNNILLKKKPETIIYLTYVGNFYQDYDFRKMKYYFNPNIVPYLVKYLDSKTLLSHTDAFVDSFLGEVSVFYKYRSSFQKIAMVVLKDSLGIEKRFMPCLFKYRVDKPQSFFLTVIEKAHKQKFHLTKSTQLSQDMFNLWAQAVLAKKIRLIVIEAPTHPLLKETYSMELNTDFHSFLTTQARELGFIYLSTENLPTFSENEFTDFSHLNAAGRRKFTDFLENYLYEFP